MISEVGIVVMSEVRDIDTIGKVDGLTERGAETTV